MSDDIIELKNVINDNMMKMDKNIWASVRIFYN